MGKLSQMEYNGLFLPTPSARRATGPWPKSIRQLVDFYPRPPRGGRRDGQHLHPEAGEFLPTPSARRATTPTSVTAPPISISTHALREEGDC